MYSLERVTIGKSYNNKMHSNKSLKLKTKKMAMLMDSHLGCGLVAGRRCARWRARFIFPWKLTGQKADLPWA